MQEIEKIRSEIDQIHGELAALMRKRLSLTKRIWELKKLHNLPLHDPSRETQIIHQFDETLECSQEKQVLRNFFKSVLQETRIYLETKLK